MQHFKIVALNELNEPFNSNDIYTTPKYVNVNEYVNFFYSSTSGLSLKGNEKWVWDFDYNKPLNQKDNPIQDFLGFNQPLPVLFYRGGDRLVNVKVYDRIPKKSVKLQSNNEISVLPKPIQNIYNSLTNHLLVINDTSNKLTVIDATNDAIIKTINLSNSPKWITWCPTHNCFYISLNNNTVDVINANNETVSANINLGVSGTIGEILYVSVLDLVYVISGTNLVVIDATSNTVVGNITIQNNSQSLHYYNNFLWFVNTTNNTISKVNINTTVVTTIPTNNNPQNLIIDSEKNLIYIRCLNSVDVCNLNVVINTVPVDAIVDSSDIVLNNTLEEIYIVSGTNSSLQVIDNNSYELLPKTINIKGIKCIYYDDVTNSIYTNYIIQKTPLIQEKRTRILDASDFSDHTYFITTGDTYSFYKLPNGKIYGLEKIANKVTTFNLYPTNSNQFVDGKLLYSDTIHFFVFEFPTTILGLEYALEGQNLSYSTNSGSNSAQNYEWFINGDIQTSIVNSMSFNFTNYVKAIIKVKIKNGRITKELNFTTSLSVGSSVIGQKYEGNVKDKLMFFNKEGDNLNFSLVENEYGDTQWEGDLIFHPNSDDTFKTIGLYTLESVDPLSFTSDNLTLRKLQLFNEYGFDIEGGLTNGTNFYIDSIDVVNNEDGFYTKWLYGNEIDKKVPIGTELFIKDFYNVTINNSVPENPIITNSDIIEDLNSYSTSGGIDLFTVVGNKRNAIMVITKTLNENFVNNYNYGDFRLQNNVIQKVPKGQIVLLNLFKIYNTQNLNVEWNEPFYKVLLYDKKKISLVNSQNNDGVFTTNFVDDDLSNDINSKYLKWNCININDILPSAKYDFRIKLDFKTNKIYLGNSPVDFLPASTDPFLNEKSVLVWESVLDKDYTPKLLKDGLRFSFGQVTPTVTNFNKLYTAVKIDTAKNILEYQTSDMQGWKLVLNDYDVLKNFKFDFLINGKSKYSAVEGLDWKRGNSLNDSAKSLATYLDSSSEKVVGLSVIAINNEVWIWEKRNYSFLLTTTKDSTFDINRGILKENNPEYGVIGDVWTLLDNVSANGYVHYRELQGNYHILYVTGNQTKNWYTLPVSKKVIWTEQVDKTNPNLPNGEIIEYGENFVGDSYLEDTTIYFSQKGDLDINTTPEMVIERFVNENKSTFIGYGLDVVNQQEKLCIINNFSTKNINTYNDYVGVTFQPEFYAIFGTAGTAGTPKFVSSTSSYISSQIVDMVNILESVKPEKNRVIGNYTKSNSISSIWERKILIKDIDQKTGLVLNINGIDYHVPYNNLSVLGLDNQEDTIVDIEATIQDWGNQKFKLSQDTTTLVDDSDVGKPYYEVLELQGVLVWLEKSEESYINGIKHFDTIVIQSKYPNVSVTYSVNGTLDFHKVLHSDIEFLEIGRELSLTINRTVYSILNAGGIIPTINAWVDEWKDTLLEQGIVVNSLDAIYDTSGTSATLIDYPKLRLGTLQEKTQLKYQVWIGKSSVLGKPSYIITDYRKGNQGIILSGNEIRINVADFEQAGFATAMIMALKDSKFPLNNQEYNILFVDPNIIGLSYQGGFWNNTDTTNHYIQRSGFNWEDYKQIFLASNIVNGYFSTNGITQLTDLSNATYMEYEAFNDYMWITHNNGFNGKITIYDVYDFSTKGEVIVSNNPTYMKWNPLNNKMYVSNKGSNRISVIDTDTFLVENQIPTGISPTQMVIDNYTNYLYVVNEDSDDITVIDLNNHTVYTTIPVGDKPVKMSLDRTNRLLYIACRNNNRVYIIDTISNSLKSYVNVGINPSDVAWIEKNNKVYVSNTGSNTLSVLTYNEITDSFSVKTINTQPNPNSLQYNTEINTVYVSCTNRIQIIDSVLDILQTTLFTPSTIGMIKYIPFTNSLFYTMPVINHVGLFSITDEFYQLTNLPVGNTPNYISSSTNNIVFVTNSSSSFVSLLEEVPFTASTSGTSGEYILTLSTRQFLRYPRERFIGEEPIYFKYSWEDEDESMFYYDFSGKQLFIEMKNQNGKIQRINNNGVYNYTGVTPLIVNNDNAYLNAKSNRDLKQTTNPKVQQTVFDELYFDLDLVDSETDLDPRPFPMQVFIGYNSKNEGVNSRTLKIERIENISLTVTTRLKDDTNPSLGYIDILDFNGETNEIKTKNSKLNFIEAGFKVGQIIELSGKDILNTKNQATFNNAGYLGKITKVFVNRMILTPLNKGMKTESTYSQTYSLLSPFRPKDATIQVRIDVKPTTIAKVRLKGQTEIEDERFKVLLNNFGYNINFRDIYIFKEYDIKEAGIDWIFLNQKRKEMLVNYSDIFNYLGSYKALINSVNYFGYDDLEVYEYYLNIDKQSDHYNKLHKIEIPDMFDSSVEGYNPKDFIIQSLPNNRYQKTRLFNLTYRITDLEGNYILGYSLDEVITKLLGLKKWLRENIMPIGTRISDLTGRGDTPATTTLWHDVKQSRKFSVNEELTPIDFKVEAYLQPVENYSKTYNVHIEFFTQTTENVSDYYHVNIYTFSAQPNFDDPNFKLRCVQNYSYYKTDFKPLNFTADRYTDPFILIETISDNGYGATYSVRKTWSLELEKFI